MARLQRWDIIEWRVSSLCGSLCGSFNSDNVCASRVFFYGGGGGGGGRKM